MPKELDMQRGIIWGMLAKGIEKDMNHTLKKYEVNGHEVYCLYEYSWYGHLLRQWGIDGQYNSRTYLDKYSERYVFFDCSNGLMADFTIGLIEEEFCIPLGINYKDERFRHPAIAGGRIFLKSAIESWGREHGWEVKSL